jgi:HupE / UreJ protein
MKKIALFCVCLFLPMLLSAHAMDLEGLPTKDIALIYLKLGYTHILPLGLDHILFVLCLFFLSPNLKTILWQATAFTIAHSITLAMAVYGVFSPPASIVEPIIAVSILFVALENTFISKLKPTRIILIALFGLIHGMGFASVLTDIGLPKTEYVTGLIMFNVGVELGQISVILLAWFGIAYWFRKKIWYRKVIVIPVSILIACIAFYWTIERIFFA